MERTPPPLRGKTFGARVVEVYESRGWSRAEFERELKAAEPKKLGKLNYKTIMAWERGAIPKMPTVNAISRVSGYSVDELMRDPPEAGAEEEEAAADQILSDEEVSELLDKLGSSAELKSKVQRELTAYPPRAGATHYEVVRLHRIMSRNTPRLAGELQPENLELDAELKRNGIRHGEQKDLRAGVAAELNAIEPATAERRARGKS